METMDYRETSRILQAEGFSTEDIDAAINSLVESGITYADEDELLLTEDEVGAVRDQLVAAAGSEDHGEPRGPGRPEIGRMVNVRMPEDMITALDAKRGEAGLSRAEVIRAIVAAALGTEPDAGIRW